MQLKELLQSQFYYLKRNHVYSFQNILKLHQSQNHQNPYIYLFPEVYSRQKGSDCS